MNQVQSYGSFVYSPNTSLGRFDYKLLKQFNEHLSSIQEDFTNDHCLQFLVETFCKALLRKDDQLPIVEIIDLHDHTVRLINHIAGQLLEINTLIKRCVDEESNQFDCDQSIDIISDMYALVVSNQLQVDAFRDCMNIKAHDMEIPQSWFLKMSLYLNAKASVFPGIQAPSTRHFNAIFISADEVADLSGFRRKNKKQTIIKREKTS